MRNFSLFVCIFLFVAGDAVAEKRPNSGRDEPRVQERPKEVKVVREKPKPAEKDRKASESDGRLGATQKRTLKKGAMSLDGMNR